MAKLVVGTPGYTPPEILQEQPYDFKADVWGLGNVFYALLAGRLPFFDADQRVGTFLTCNKQLDFGGVEFSEYSPLILDLLNKMLDKD